MMTAMNIFPDHDLDRLSNTLVSSHQLSTLLHNDDSQATSRRFAQAVLTQAAGILLQLPQQVIATAIVFLQRSIVATAGRSESSPRLGSAACIYLSAKLSITPLSPRSVVNVYAYLFSPASPLTFINPISVSKRDSQAYYVTPGQHELHLQQLFAAEASLLAALGFSADVVLPHVLALTYLQVLANGSEVGSQLAKRVLAHLNTSLLSPQLLYLTHQPNALAVAAIYIAAREEEVKLVHDNWWEVFDVDREDLGFLVLAMGSSANFAVQEYNKWRNHDIEELRLG